MARARIGVTVALAGVAALALAGCSGGGPEPVQKPITDVQSGDCFDTDAAYTTAVVYPDCASPHLYEAFHVEQLESDAFPGDEAVSTRANELCNAEFQAFTGLSVAQSTEYASMFLGPTEQSWTAEGDRAIVCVVMPMDGQARGGSAGLEN